MKPFIEYFKEQAQQPQTHGGIQGKSVTITKQADGTQWCAGATVTQITPDNQADIYNLELTNGNTIKVKLTPDQTHGITQGQEVVAVHDGFEFFFGKSADKGQVTEAEGWRFVGDRGAHILMYDAKVGGASTILRSPTDRTKFVGGLINGRKILGNSPEELAAKLGLPKIPDNLLKSFFGKK
ncbi:hypothetical protein SFP_0087 [Salmonella phage SFP10]|uniref:Hypothetical transmembrane protein n=1 Tax=Salmonella phage SFP10 TaxID=1080800 RepID=G4WAK4_9CAUD|nr:hypothetical protein SFP_0087 [Salmonella phage SFP10]AEN94182.1 hypothetical transmembrane protein [Salmonella phage SFP10]